jgi:hypothetical protein
VETGNSKNKSSVEACKLNRGMEFFPRVISPQNIVSFLPKLKNY